MQFLFITIEPYKDYEFWYQSYAYNFLYTDWLPYVSENLRFYDLILLFFDISDPNFLTNFFLSEI